MLESFPIKLVPSLTNKKSNNEQNIKAHQHRRYQNTEFQQFVPQILPGRLPIGNSIEEKLRWQDHFQ